MIKIKNIDDFKIGQNIYSFAQCLLKEKKISKNGDAYIDVLFRDQSGKINGKIWSFVDFYESVFNEGDIVAIKGEIKRFRGKLFINVNNIANLSNERYDKYGFDPELIYPSIDYSINEIFKNLQKIISNLDNPYKKLVETIFNKYASEIKLFPDDMYNYQFNKKGGLILKIYNAINIALKITKKRKVSSSLIFAGVLLKYIGRVKQYEYNIIFKEKNIGKTENCLILSRDIIKSFSKELNLDKNTFNEIIDIILYEPSISSNLNHLGALVYHIFEIDKSISSLEYEL